MGDWRRTTIGILFLGMSACGPLEPMIMEPEVSDLQLTMDTLKTALRDAQRTIVELRTEIDARRQELADVQIARAQLEGRIREAERRLTEARHVIDLQREELAGSRAEREQVERTKAELQSHLRQHQKKAFKVGKQMKESVSPTALVAPHDGSREVSTIDSRQNLSADLEEDTRVVPMPVTHVSTTSSTDEPPMISQAAMSSHVHVSVKSGDTLWSIARRYHTSVRRLMMLNALPSDRIQVGQALWLTEPSALEPE